MASNGIIGVLLFALGGAFFAYVLVRILFEGGRALNRFDYMVGFMAGGFVAFLLFGLGLWLITQDGKPETKLTLPPP